MDSQSKTGMKQRWKREGDHSRSGRGDEASAHHELEG